MKKSESHIKHQTSVARTPQQNGVVERRNHTLMEAARTMLNFSKAQLFLWAEAVVTAFCTKNRSLIKKRHNKTPYELLHDRKPNLSYLHIFGALCYPIVDGEDLGKLKPKASIGIFVYLLRKALYGLKQASRAWNDNETKLVNQTLRVYHEEVRISHQTSVARTPQQNGVVERRNHTLMEAARTMLNFSKAQLFLWAEAVVTAFCTQNRSLIKKRHNKTPYELLYDRKPNLSYLHVFGALCYPIVDGEDLGKLKPKASIGIFVSYAPAKKAFCIYNNKTRMIIETIYVD
nr:retrovirus-related Pol polyprotein from transposon TNT 1-94 [Tanacetum cinerariifolium]